MAGRGMAGSEFHILCGFVGSGKTTLLLDFLATPEGADTAVLVNDVGAIDVDGVVVAGAATGAPVSRLIDARVLREARRRRRGRGRRGWWHRWTRRQRC